MHCAHCGDSLEPTPRRHHSTGKGQNLFCNNLCKFAYWRARRKSPPSRDKVCPQCNEGFTTKYYDKMFCSMKCYVESDLYREVRDKARRESIKARRSRAGLQSEKLAWECLECGKKHSTRPSRNRKFCNSTCYRKYMARRFDRWIASPQTIALPQNYDEFLTLEELPCLVEGCNWRGHNLSFHMNMAHGVQARDFKKAAGFNLKSGIISLPLQEALRGWQRKGTPFLIPGYPGAPWCSKPKSYHSLEGKEHRQKGLVLALESYEGLLKVCQSCEKPYAATFWARHQKYCTAVCREAFYKRRRKTRKESPHDPQT